MRKGRRRRTGEDDVRRGHVAAVCDTHALMFYAFGGQRLGRQAATLFDACDAREATIYVPAAVIIEFGLVLRGRRTSRGHTAPPLLRGPVREPGLPAPGSVTGAGLPGRRGAAEQRSVRRVDLRGRPPARSAAHHERHRDRTLGPHSRRVVNTWPAATSISSTCGLPRAPLRGARGHVGSGRIRYRALR